MHNLIVTLLIIIIIYNTIIIYNKLVSFMGKEGLGGHPPKKSFDMGAPPDLVQKVTL